MAVIISTAPGVSLWTQSVSALTGIRLPRGVRKLFCAIAMA